MPWQKPVFDTVRPADPGQVGEKGVLIFSKTNGFRHESIEPGIEALKKSGKEKGWDVRTTENGRADEWYNFKQSVREKTVFRSY